MKYYVELFWQFWRILFRFFHNPYCPKWDEKLKEIMEFADEVICEPNQYSNNKVLTILFKYQGEEYLIWTSNGFYATGSLHKLNGLSVPDKHQRRPSFDVQYKLLSMKYEYEQGQVKQSLEEFEKGLYKEDNK